MKVSSKRTINDLKPVLMDQSLEGDEVVYEVQTEIEENKDGWVNKTILYPEMLNNEYPKTFGHYHNVDKDEVYKVLEGEGFLLKQNEKEVILVKLSEGVEHKITPQWGHCLINTGNTPLVVLDNWSWGHKDQDYKDVKDHHGMGYYITSVENEVILVLNPHYPKTLELSFHQSPSEAPQE